MPRVIASGATVKHAGTVPWVSAVVAARSVPVARNDSAHRDATGDAWLAKCLTNTEPRGAAAERHEKAPAQRAAEEAREEALLDNWEKIARQEEQLRALLQEGAGNEKPPQDQQKPGALLHACPEIWGGRSHVPLEVSGAPPPPPDRAELEAAQADLLAQIGKIAGAHAGGVEEQEAAHKALEIKVLNPHTFNPQLSTKP